MSWSLGSPLPAGWTMQSTGGYFPARKSLHHEACGWTSLTTYDYAMEPTQVRLAIAEHVCAGGDGAPAE